MPLNNQKIAVVGISCRYPGANDLLEFWENILAGRQQFRSFPKGRISKNDYFHEDEKREDKTYLDQAAFIDGWKFDWVKWKIPRQSFESTDPSHWLALEQAVKAVQMAGGIQEKVKKKTGVYVGNTLTGEFTRAQVMRLRWPYVARALKKTLEQKKLNEDDQQKILEEMEDQYKKPFPKTCEDSLAGGLSNTIAGRICNYFKLGGGGYTVDGACSSSLLAVITAVEKLASGEIDFALAGGVDISLDPFEIVGFAKAGALAKGPLAIYDQKACGMIPGEGAGFVVLKRLEDAEKDGDTILSIISGWGISSDGDVGITAPTAEGQARALERAWKRANFSPDSIDFIEGHGTGTTLGDKVELSGMALALESLEGNPSKKIGVTSLKSIVGHTKAAAGIGALIKAVISTNQRVLPPTTGCINPHPVFKENAKNFFPIINGKVFETTKIVKAGVSAMGFGGINAHVAIESNSKPNIQGLDPLRAEELINGRQNSEVFLFVADDINELSKICLEQSKIVEKISKGEMVDYSFSLLNNFDKDAEFRLSIVADSPKKLFETLLSCSKSLNVNEDLPSHCYLGMGKMNTKIGFVFPGQGVQRLGMGNTILKKARDIQNLLNILENEMDSQSFNILKTSLFPDETSYDIPDLAKKLEETSIAQPAIVLTSLLWLRKLKDLGISPDFTAGHSLGELLALYEASNMSEETLLKLAVLRGKVMSGASQEEGMLALLTNSKVASQILKDTLCQDKDISLPRYAVIANINGYGQTIISGAMPTLEIIKSFSHEKGIGAKYLNVSRAFHSHFMNESAQKLSETDEINNIFNLNKKFISGINGEVKYDFINLRTYLPEQIVKGVNFLEVGNTFDDNTSLVFEVGPGTAMNGILSKSLQKRRFKCFSTEQSQNSVDGISHIVAVCLAYGININLKNYFQNRCIRPFVNPTEKIFINNPCEDGDLTFFPQRQEKTTPPPKKVSLENKSLIDLLKKLVFDLTGFPEESLSGDHRLLDDLNLDSIKAGELVSTFAKHIEDGSKLDPGSLANASLNEIVSLAGEKEIKDNTKIDFNDTWVHSFTSMLCPSPINLGPNLLEDAKYYGSSGPIINLLKKEIKEDQKSSNKIIFLSSEENILNQLPFALSDLKPDGTIIFIDQHPLYPMNEVTRIEGICSFAASLHLEQPKLKIKVIGIDPLADEVKSLKHILDEISVDSPFDTVQYDLNGNRYISKLCLTFPEKDFKEPLPNGVVLVSGGAKGITHASILELGKLGIKNFAIFGSSKINEIIKKNLSLFNEYGSSAKYYTCDVTNPESVKENLNQVLKEQGKIEWFIHGAGANKPELAHLVNTENAHKEIAPKLFGFQNIITQLDLSSLKKVVSLTSIIGVTGMARNAWYAFSNESCHRSMIKLKQGNPHIKTLSLAYSIWDEIGMGVKLNSVKHLENHGIWPIPPAEGIKSFVDWCLSSVDNKEIVIAGRLKSSSEKMFLDTWKRNDLKTNYQGRFLEKIMIEEPQVELVATCTLSQEKDEYIKDHIYDGKPLFPTVFGIEAMAQGVRRLLDEEIEQIEIQDLKLDHPIIVNGPTDIELRIKRLDKNLFDCEIRCSHTSYAFAHFKGKFKVISNFSLKICPSMVNFETPLPLEKEDLYGTGKLLFQGECYQRIDKVFKINSNASVIKIKSQEHKAKWYQEYNSLILGDPFKRDALLQSGQLIISPRKGLPISIDKWFIKPSKSDFYTHSTITKDMANQIEGLVEAFDEKGNLTETLTNYTIRIISNDMTLPTFNDFNNPTKRNREILDQSLNEITRVFDINLPQIYLTFEKDLTNKTKEERRSYARIVLGSDLHYDKDIPQMTNGYVSISHDEDHFFAVTGNHPIGCDIVKIKNRPWDQMIKVDDKDLLPSMEKEFATAHVWAAREAFYKLRGSYSSDIKLIKNHQDGCLLESHGTLILTVEVKFTFGIWVLAFTTDYIKKENSNFNISLHALEDSSRGKRGETRFLYRFPLAFSNVINASGNIHFTTFIEWLGKTREVGIRKSGLFQMATNHVLTGEFAWVTKETELLIIGHPNPDDLIEVECWNERLYGSDDSSLELVFNWMAVSSDGQRKKIAESIQTTTWAKVISEGVVAPSPFPQDMLPWIKETMPRFDQGKDRLSFNGDISSTEKLGSLISKNVLGPDLGSPLYEFKFRTTPQNSNLVGNIYWAWYYKWMGETRDNFILEKSKYGEVIIDTLYTKISHFREAMPGDHILVRMHLEGIYKKGTRLIFTFFKINEEGKEEKLATGIHDICILKQNSDNIFSNDYIKIKSVPQTSELVIE